MNRYARRDFGRCTGSDVNCEDNLLPSICDYDLGRISAIYMMQDSIRNLVSEDPNSEENKSKIYMLNCLAHSLEMGISPSARLLV